MIPKNRVTGPWFKIVEETADGGIRTLFHGVGGSRLLEREKWLGAEEKTVRDAALGDEYLSGWHVFDSLCKCREYLKRFKSLRGKLIVRCYARHVRRKGERSDAYLARHIRILGEEGDCRV